MLNVHAGLLTGAAARRRAGVSLIEVLVAILVVSLGLLAMAGLMGAATRFGKTAEFRATATLLIADLSDRMRANRGGLAQYSLTPNGLAQAAPAAVPCAASDACTPAELAAVDLAEWQASVFAGLPNGTGYVLQTDVANGLFDVWVVWRDPAALSSGEYVNAGTANQTCPPGFNADPVPRCMFMRVGL